VKKIVIGVALGVALLLTACDKSPAIPQAEPAHEVDFAVTAIGSANDDVEITWSAGSGASGSTTVAGSTPYWARSVTSDEGTDFVNVTAQGWSTDARFSLICAISVEGVEVAREQGSSCSAVFYFRNLASALANRPSPTPTPSPSPSKATLKAPPAGCRFLTNDEVSAVVRELSNVDKPVQVSGGSANLCSYVIDYESTSVRVRWEPGAKAELTAADVKVPGLPETAYWLDLGTLSNLQVQRKNGLFTVTVQAVVLALDRKKLATEIYLTARPELP